MSKRSSLRHARRIVCLMGTAVVTEDDGHVAIDRVATAVKALCELKKEGHEIIVVTSGAVGIGQDFVRKQEMLQGSLEAITEGRLSAGAPGQSSSLRTCAAAGQVGLMMLYSTLFSQCDEPCAQILTTEAQLRDGSAGAANLSTTVADLLALGVVPVINENDVMSTRDVALRDTEGAILWDNESLAMLVARECFADAVLCITDTPGLVSAVDGAAVVPQHTPGSAGQYGAAAGSRVGAQGVAGLAGACEAAVERGWVRTVVVLGLDDIRSVMAGQAVGTMFTREASDRGGGSGGASKAVVQAPREARSRL